MVYFLRIQEKNTLKRRFLRGNIMKKLFLILFYIFFVASAISAVLDVFYCDVTSMWNVLMWNFIILTSISGALKIRYNK